MIAIIDYGVGNLGSIQNMLNYLQIEAKMTCSVEDIWKADKLILPGVGAFDAGMEQLKLSGLKEILDEEVLGKHKSILGICLGMQLMTKGSEEGKMQGLGWFNAHTKKFVFDNNSGMLVPHMGWNEISIKHQHTLFNGLEEENKFYFVHSYYVQAEASKEEAATTFYGHDFASVMVNEHIMGCQFHPEKSHRFGMRLLKNFCQS